MFDQIKMIKNFLLHFENTVLLVLNVGTSWHVNWLPESSSSVCDCRRNARSSSTLPYLDPILFCLAFNNICSSALLGFTRNSKIYFIITANDIEVWLYDISFCECWHFERKCNEIQRKFINLGGLSRLYIWILCFDYYFWNWQYFLSGKQWCTTQ